MKRKLIFILICVVISLFVITSAAANGNCGDNLNWSFSNQGVLSISGFGAMTNYNNSNPPWQSYSYELTSIVINEGVTTIGNYAFDFYSDNLSSVFLPSSLTQIGSYALSVLPDLCMIQYNGTAAEWKEKVTIKNGNAALTTDRLHFAACTHALTSHAAVAASCSAPGNNAYWSCDKCGKFFSDANGKNEIEADSWVIQAAHSPAAAVEENRIDATCSTAGHYDLVSRCSVCLEIINTTPKTSEALGHDFSDWSVTTEPTCTEPGEKIHTCSRCLSTETMPVNALGHNIEHHDSQPATCTSAGWESYDTCKRRDCDYTTKIELPALGHDFGDWSVTAEPTCTEPGEKIHTCSRCLATETLPVDALGHDIEHHDSQPPTCIAAGWESYDTCKRYHCDYSTKVVSPPTGQHTPSKPVEKTITDATCTIAGSKINIVYCSVCGDEFSRTTASIDALGHDYGEWTVIIEPTCTSVGKETRKCSRCDTTEIQTMNTINHPFGEWIQTTAPTCLEDGEEIRYCSYCDASETRVASALGHELTKIDKKSPTYTEPGNSEYWTCSRCAIVFHDELGIHEFDEQDSFVIAALKDMNVLNLPSGLEVIEEEAFAGIVSEAVIIPENCREIGPKAFADSKNLRYVLIPKNVTWIAENAFDGCNKIILDIEQE